MPAAQGLPVEDAFAELDIVRLRSIVYDDDRVFPVGAIGTIVYRHPGGAAYEVEFGAPDPTVLTLRSSDLALVE